jgi:hypothetical protein
MVFLEILDVNSQISRLNAAVDFPSGLFLSSN